MASVQSEQYKKAVESPELTVTSAVLLAAARHLAEACRTDATNYMKYVLLRCLLLLSTLRALT